MGPFFPFLFFSFGIGSFLRMLLLSESAGDWWVVERRFYWLKMDAF